MVRGGDDDRSEFDITLDRVGDDPVLARDPDGWDRDRVADPDIRHIDGQYHILYDGAGPDHWAVGHATSTDLVNWQKDPDNPVLETGRDDSWDCFRVVDPGIVEQDGTYYMLYSGKRGTHQQIGLATSSDWTGWQKHENNPLLRYGPNGHWNQGSVANAEIRRNSGVYHLLYQGGYSPGGREIQIGHARSEDLLNWTLDPDNPVFTTSENGFDSNKTTGPTFAWIDGLWHLFYSGSGSETEYRQIGHAVSPDLVAWHRNPDNPVLTPGAPGSWDDHSLSNPSLAQNPRTENWVLVYSGQNSETGKFHLGIAEVSNL